MDTSTLTIQLPRQEEERLSRLAVRYGLSVPEIARKILESVSLEFPEDAFDEYVNPEETRISFFRALDDWRAGRVSESL